MSVGNFRGWPSRSFVFFNGLFYKVLIVSLALSVISKSIINLAIEPVDVDGSLADMEGQFYPYPPGRLAITHYENWHEGWPDYSDGIFGTVSSSIEWIIERFVEFDNLELVVFIGLVALIVGAVTLSTIGKSRPGLSPEYVGLGLIFAAAISNQGEVALFGHATDFLLIRYSSSSDIGGVANFADVMLVIGFVLILLTATYQRVMVAIDTNRGPINNGEMSKAQALAFTKSFGVEATAIGPKDPLTIFASGLGTFFNFIFLIPTFIVMVPSTMLGGYLVTVTFGLLLLPLRLLWLPFLGFLLGSGWLWVKVPLSRPFLIFPGVLLSAVANIYIAMVPDMGQSYQKQLKMIICNLWPYSYLVWKVALRYTEAAAEPPAEEFPIGLTFSTARK